MKFICEHPFITYFVIHMFMAVIATGMLWHWSKPENAPIMFEGVEEW